MKRFVAVLAALGGLAVGFGSTAGAAPNLSAAEKQCAALAKPSNSHFDVFPSLYDCSHGSFTEKELKAARALCEQGYGGTFNPVDPSSEYFCFLP